MASATEPPNCFRVTSAGRLLKRYRCQILVSKEAHEKVSSSTYLEVIRNVVVAAARLCEQAGIVARRRRRRGAIRGRSLGVVVVGFLLGSRLVLCGGRHDVFVSRSLSLSSFSIGDAKFEKVVVVVEFLMSLRWKKSVKIKGTKAICGGKDDVDDKLLGQEGAAWLESGAGSAGAYHGELRVWLCRNCYRIL